MINWKQILTVVAISTCITSGYAFACNKQGAAKSDKHQGCGCKKGEKGKFKQKISNRLNSKLDLTAEQKTKVDSIFDEVHPKMEAIRKSTDQQIRAVLNPEQQAKFDKMVEKRAERHKEWHSPE
jgi:Spy/CpxP family protein refolding chaperone